MSINSPTFQYLFSRKPIFVPQLGANKDGRASKNDDDKNRFFFAPQKTSGMLKTSSEKIQTINIEPTKKILMKAFSFNFPAGFTEKHINLSFYIFEGVGCDFIWKFETILINCQFAFLHSHTA